MDLDIKLKVVTLAQKAECKSHILLMQMLLKNRVLFSL